ncbi:natriuretic peptides A-like [Mantella aurantiaca]
MEWKAYLLCGSLLLVYLHLQTSIGHPITEQDMPSDLDSFKTFLERLEEKLEDLEESPERMEERAQRPNDSGDPLLESTIANGNPFPLSNAILKGLRSLHTTKMTRGSNCFGRRIDRINSVSGMGCNGARKDETGDPECEKNLFTQECQPASNRSAQSSGPVSFLGQVVVCDGQAGIALKGNLLLACKRPLYLFGSAGMQMSSCLGQAYVRVAPI